MDGRPTGTDCDEARDYVGPNVLSPKDLVLVSLQTWQHGQNCTTHRKAHTPRLSLYCFDTCICVTLWLENRNILSKECMKRTISN